MKESNTKKVHGEIFLIEGFSLTNSGRVSNVELLDKTIGRLSNETLKLLSERRDTITEQSKPTASVKLSAWDARMKEINENMELKQNAGNDRPGTMPTIKSRAGEIKLSAWDARMKEINENLKNQ
jgi:hypothetical protein